ncbi:MAG TPA: nuclear transport factor 2 family protein [Allosphingosinicella sp.]|jgi:ketosteroid isomerase-like protein
MQGPEEAFDLYRKLINDHDFHVLEELVIDPAITCVFGNIVHRGMAAVRAAFEAAWSDLPDETYEMSEPEWVPSGSDIAVVLFRYAFQGTRQGQPVVGSGCGTNVYRLSSRGWRLVHEHLSADSTAAEA